MIPTKEKPLSEKAMGGSKRIPNWLLTKDVAEAVEKLKEEFIYFDEEDRKILFSMLREHMGEFFVPEKSVQLLKPTNESQISSQDNHSPQFKVIQGEASKRSDRALMTEDNNIQGSEEKEDEVGDEKVK